MRRRRGAGSSAPRAARSHVLKEGVVQPADQVAGAVERERVADEAQVTVATAIAATHIMKVLRVFFERTSPA